MNTLPRAITARFFPDSDSYNSFRAHWRTLLRSTRKHELTAAHHLLYLAFTGKDWRKGFTCPTNPHKLANGAYWGWVMFRALQNIQFKYMETALLAPFDGFITPEMLANLRPLLPTGNPYTYHPADFTPGQFPFEAYLLPVEAVTRS